MSQNELLQLEEMIEGVSLPIGTTRKWSGQDMIKVGPARWEPAPANRNPKWGGGDKVGDKPTGEGPNASTDPMGALSHAIKTGKVKGTLAEHTRIGHEFLGKHAAGLEAAKESIKAFAAPGSEVKARVKDLASTMGKLARKSGKYKDATDLQDGTGMRIVCNTIDDVKGTVERISAAYEILTQDDYISKPAEGHYRSHHLIIRDRDGLAKEVQVRTKRQDDFANWSHDVYKPHTKAQADAAKTDSKTLDDYAKAQSERYFALDQGKEAPPPPCPPVVKNVFGCLN